MDRNSETCTVHGGVFNDTDEPNSCSHAGYYFGASCEHETFRSKPAASNHTYSYTCQVCNHARSEHDAEGYCNSIDRGMNYVPHYCSCDNGRFTVEIKVDHTWD